MKRYFAILAIFIILMNFFLFSYTAFGEETSNVNSVNDILDRFMKSSDKISLSFGKKYYEQNGKYFRLGFFDKNYPSFRGRIIYTNDIYAIAPRNFLIMFNSKYYRDFIKSFSTYLIIAIDPTIKISDAEMLAEKLVSSFSGEYSEVLPNRIGFSDIISVGKYLLIIESHDDLISSIFVRHTNDINKPVDKSQYSAISFKDIKSNKHANQKVFLNGIVEKQYSDIGELLPQKNMIILSSSERYIAKYYPYILPIDFELGGEYTFYGYIDQDQVGDYPSMIIQYAIKENGI